MSEVKIVKAAQPHLTVSSTDPFRMVGRPTQHTPTKGPPGKPAPIKPRVSSFDNTSAGVRMQTRPVQHDMRRSGPASNGKATPVTPLPMKASEASEAAQAAARTKAAPAERELAAQREELEALRAENAQLRQRENEAQSDREAEAAKAPEATGEHAGGRPIELE